MNVTVMGLGLFGGGAGAARYFAERGHTVRVTDLRSEDELFPAVNELSDLSLEYHLGAHPEEIFREAEVVVVNPGVKPGNPLVALARESGAKLTTEINMVFELARAPIVGVTGSNGKSTVAAMLAACLEADGREVLLGGNLGGSLLGRAANFDPEGLIVLELSSFQLARLAWIERSPHLAICTNVTPNHLDWHPDLEDYAGSKANIARFQSAEDFLIVNADCPVCSAWTAWAPALPARFSLSERPAAPGAWIQPGDEPVLAVAFDDSPGFFGFPRALRGMKAPGEHNRANALAAALGATLLGARPESVDSALAGFNGLPHRLEFVAEVNGVRFYNDSVATTPEAGIAALNSFEGPVALIAGGSDKGLGLEEFGRAAAARCEVVVVTGRTGPAIRGAIERAGGGPRVLEAADFDEAFSLAARNARPDGVVLLSPASASFDQFPNFAARGERFRTLVGEL
jgi:UDP-N-acetylmuramoylalanine--D-glutamate ligase